MYRASPPRTRISRQKKKRPVAFRYLTIFLALFIVGGAWWHTRNVSTATPSPTKPTPIAASPTPSGATFATSTVTQIQAAVQTIINANSDLTFGVSFQDFNSGAHFDINGNQSFTAASTTKVLTAILFLKGVEAGTYSLNQPLGDYNASYQLQQMINQSNNDSWSFFNTLLGFPAEQSFATSLGLTSYQSDQNSFSPNDMATLLKKLYSGELLNQSDTKLLLSYMQNTNEESLIPAGLPQGAIVYHKYGELDDKVHDAAIIQDKNHTFILTIYSSGDENEDYDRRAAIFHQIVQAITTNLSS